MKFRFSSYFCIFFLQFSEYFHVRTLPDSEGVSHLTTAVTWLHSVKQYGS